MMRLWEKAGLTWTQPIASSVAFLFSWLSPTAAMVLFFVFWWIHTLTILAFLVYIPQSKHAHLIAAPVNVYLTNPTPGKLEPLSFDFDEDGDGEEEFSFGVGKVEDFDHLQMMDLYACVECGRC